MPPSLNSSTCPPERECRPPTVAAPRKLGARDGSLRRVSLRKRDEGKDFLQRLREAGL